MIDYTDLNLPAQQPGPQAGCSQQNKKLSRQIYTLGDTTNNIMQPNTLGKQYGLRVSFLSVYVSAHTLMQGFPDPGSGDFSVLTHLLKLVFNEGSESGVPEQKITRLDLGIPVYFQSRSHVEWNMTKFSMKHISDVFQNSEQYLVYMQNTSTLLFKECKLVRGLMVVEVLYAFHHGCVCILPSFLCFLHICLFISMAVSDIISLVKQYQSADQSQSVSQLRQMVRSTSLTCSLYLYK